MGSTSSSRLRLARLARYFVSSGWSILLWLIAEDRRVVRQAVIGGRASRDPRDNRKSRSKSQPAVSRETAYGVGWIGGWSGLMVLTIRSRSSRDANSTTILPLRWPSSTFTRVSSTSERRPARSAKRGATGWRRGCWRDGFAGSAPIATISSTARTDRPSATMRCARSSWAWGSATARGLGHAQRSARRPRLGAARWAASSAAGSYW